MNDEIKECFILLKTYKNKLNYQQYNTFKGQIKSGDYAGFKKGLFFLVLRKQKQATL